MMLDKEEHEINIESWFCTKTAGINQLVRYFLHACLMYFNQVKLPMCLSLGSVTQ